MLDVMNSLGLLFGRLELATVRRRYLAQKIILQKPSRIQQAEDRLQSAVARLEAVSEAAIQDTSISDSTSEERVVALEAELQDLKLQNNKLRTINDKVGNSLDKVIVKLKSVLEE